MDKAYWVKQNPGSMSLHRTNLDWKDNSDGSFKDSGDNDLCFVEPEYF